MTLREIFHQAEANSFYRFLHFPSPASAWTLNMAVLIEEPDQNDPDHAPPPPTLAGYCTTTFSSDIEHIVRYVDKICGCSDDDMRLSALRYYYDHGHRVFEDWRPAKTGA